MQAWLRPVFARDDILRGEKTQLCTQPRNSRTPRCPPPSLPFPRLHPPPLPTRGPIELRSLSFLNSRTMFPLLLLLLFSFFRSSSSPTTNARPTRDYSIIPFCSMPLYERKEETRVRDKWRGGKILTVRIVSREDDTSDHSGFDWQNRAYPFPQIKGRRGKGVEINRGSPRRMASNYGGLERGR